MSPPVQSRSTSDVQKGLLDMQKASIIKILLQASKDGNSDLQKRRETAPTLASPAQIRASVTKSHIRSNSSPVKDLGSGPMELDHSYKDISGTGSIIMQTEIQIPATASGQIDAPPLTPHEDSTEPSIGGSVQADSKTEEEPPVEDDDGDDPRKMMAELERSAHSSRFTSVNIDEQFTDMEELRLKLSTLFSPGRDTPPGFIASGPKTPLMFKVEPRTETCRLAASLTKECVPYAVALQLERAGCDWEGAAQFTTYIFSSGTNGYKAQQEKDRMIKKTNDNLSEVIQQYLEDEQISRVVEDTSKLSRRLIVSNIAADAQEDDIFGMFASHFKFHVGGVRLLEKRSYNRTRTAYVDMSSRHMAVKACKIHGHIFGLQAGIDIAVPDEDLYPPVDDD